MSSRPTSAMMGRNYRLTGGRAGLLFFDPLRSTVIGRPTSSCSRQQHVRVTLALWRRVLLISERNTGAAGSAADRRQRRPSLLGDQLQRDLDVHVPTEVGDTFGHLVVEQDAEVATVDGGAEIDTKMFRGGAVGV